MSAAADTFASTDSMLSAVPADSFAGAEDLPTGESGDESIELGGDAVADETVEIPDDPAAEPPADETAEEPEATPEPEPAVDEQEELPDGVKRGRDRNGKEGLFVTPDRWNTIYQRYKEVQQYQGMMGEPLTPEAFQVRNEAYMGQERIYADLTSGDPASQSKLLNHFLDEIETARNSGEVAGDPAIPLAQSFVETLQQRNPQAYAAVQNIAAKSIVDGLYRAAAEKGDKNLFLSLGHIANNLGLPYKTEAEMQAFFQSRGQQDPVSAANARIQQLEQQLNGRSANSQAAQLQTWQQQTGQAVRNGILETAIKPAVANVQNEGYWKTHQDAFNHHVLNRLHSEVTEVIKKDAGFLDRIGILNGYAARTPSAQKRAEYGQQIHDLYVSRAQLAVDAIKGKILKDATDWAVTQSNSRHARLQAGQQQRGPKGTGTAVPKSLIPARQSGAGQTFNADEQKRLVQQLFSA